MMNFFVWWRENWGWTYTITAIFFSLTAIFFFLSLGFYLLDRFTK